MLRDHVNGNYKGLADHGGAATTHQRLHLVVGDPFITEQFAHTLIGGNIAHLGHDEEVRHPETLVQTPGPFCSKYLCERIESAAVDGIMFLQLQSRLDKGEGVKQCTYREPTGQGEREVFPFVHHVHLYDLHCLLSLAWFLPLGIEALFDCCHGWGSMSVSSRHLSSISLLIR